MSISFCSFSSGSSGNCYLIKTETTGILIDAGISASRILKELNRTDTPRENIKALFLTHEHSDHIIGARVLLKKLKNTVVYASPGTLAEVVKRDKDKNLSFAKEIEESRRISMIPEETVTIGDICVRAFRTLHDAAEPYGYTISFGKKHIAFITDTGVVTDEMLEHIADADILVLESNHDTDLLRSGGYPGYLKRRILSDYGHLSNKQAADVLLKIFDYMNKKRVVLLAHLSHENNTPAIAEKTVLTALAHSGLYTGRDLYMGVLLRNEASLLYRL